jgi:hypothetical protein
MSVLLERPRFYEGQILGADDLDDLLAYLRAADARHHRLLHSWGIAAGLELSVDDGNLQVAAGLAIDSSGAAVVLAETLSIDPTAFGEDLPGSHATGWYPVFLVGKRTDQADTSTVGACKVSQTVRILEGGAVHFAETTDLVDWDEQEAPDVDAGPDDSGESSRRVLLGYVEWDGSATFKDAKRDVDGLAQPRFAGVLADEVLSRSGRLILRTQPSGTQDAPMLVLEKDAEQALIFGTDDGSGSVKAAMSVDVEGNLTLTGSLDVPLKSGQVAMQSGVIGDGLLVPLPGGITQAMVDAGTAVVSIMLQPRPDLSPATQAGHIPLPGEQSVDGDRRVTCLVSSWPTAGGAILTSAGTCQYLILASVSESEATS